ncbi:hypothetical protein ABGF48_04255 [Helcococcus bovis]|uniref:hypothetical protein n=1 Tax=Helcococcus bovis TaxID=3153252 RepID=UPI0038B71989
MEKTIIISGKPTRFKCTGGFLIRYKQLTGNDPLKDMMGMFPDDKKKSKTIDIENINTEVIFNIIWVLAKTADNTIPDLLDWLDSFDEFLLEDIMVELEELLTRAFVSTIESKSKKKPIRK